MPERYETFTAGVEPGKTTQLSMKMPASGTLKSFFPDAGLSLSRIIAGRERPLVAADGTFEPTFVDKDVWVVAIVENKTNAVIIGKGQWLVEGDNLPKQVAQPSAGVIPPKTSRSPVVKGSAKAATRSMVPGSNEVAVCLTYGECKRLLDAICGGPPIMDTERPTYQRRFNQALATFSGEEMPQEPSDDERRLANENERLKAEIEALRVAPPVSSDSEAFRVGYMAAIQRVSKIAENAFDEEARLREMVDTVESDDGLLETSLLAYPHPPPTKSETQEG